MSKLPALADITFPEGWQDMDINQKKQLCFVGNDTQVANLKRIIIKNPKNLIERKAIPAQMAIHHVCNELKKERTKKVILIKTQMNMNQNHHHLIKIGLALLLKNLMTIWMISLTNLCHP